MIEDIRGYYYRLMWGLCPFVRFHRRTLHWAIHKDKFTILPVLMMKGNGNWIITKWKVLKSRVFLNNKMSARGAICDFPTTNTVNALKEEKKAKGSTWWMNAGGIHGSIYWQICAECVVVSLSNARIRRVSFGARPETMRTHASIFRERGWGPPRDDFLRIEYIYGDVYGKKER